LGERYNAYIVIARITILVVLTFTVAACSGASSNNASLSFEVNTPTVFPSASSTPLLGPEENPVDTTNTPNHGQEENPSGTTNAPEPSHNETDVRAVIAIHLDPNRPDINHATTQNWERLVNAVAEADRHGHKLTLLVSSDWGDLIIENQQYVDTLARWIETGHEIGFHHHTCDHVSPDGYRDVQNKCKGMINRGSVNDAFTKIQNLLVDLGTVISTAAQGPNTDGIYRSAEWQDGVILATGMIKDNSDGHSDHRFITQPRCALDYGNSYQGAPSTWPVAELGHAQLDVGSFTMIKSKNNLSTLESEIERVTTGDHSESNLHLGVVFHAREYAENLRQTTTNTFNTDKEYLEAIFALFAEKNVPVVTAQEILTANNPCDIR